MSHFLDSMFLIHCQSHPASPLLGQTPVNKQWINKSPLIILTYVKNYIPAIIFNYCNL